MSAWRHRHRERSHRDASRYRVTWDPRTGTATPALTGAYLILTPATCPGHPALATVQQALTAHGATPHTHAIDPSTGRAALTAQLAALTATHQPAAIISLLALDTTPHPGHPAVPAGLAATITLAQAHTDARPAGTGDAPPPLWCITQGAVAATATDPLPHPHQATTWGAGRVIALEHPRHWGGLIDLPADLASPHITTHLAAVLSPGQPEDQIAIRPAATYARRLTRAPAPAAPPAAPGPPPGPPSSPAEPAASAPPSPAGSPKTAPPASSSSAARDPPTPTPASSPPTSPATAPRSPSPPATSPAATSSTTPSPPSPPNTPSPPSSTPPDSRKHTRNRHRPPTSTHISKQRL